MLSPLLFSRVLDFDIEVQMSKAIRRNGILSAINLSFRRRPESSGWRGGALLPFTHYLPSESIVVDDVLICKFELDVPVREYTGDVHHD